MQKKERVVVITGGTSGIGKECRDYFTKNGDFVIVLARHNEESIPNFYQCDVSDFDNVKQVFDEIGKKYKNIDILINNAGFGISGAIELVPNENIKKLMDVNLYGVLNCYKCVLPYMKNGGKVINISSVCAMFPLPFRGLYCASKSAVNMLSLSMKMECSGFGVDVCAVCPGDVKTNFTKNRVKNFDTNDRYKDRVQNATNKVDGREDKRMSPIKVAKVVFKLCSKRKAKPIVIVGFKYKVLNFAMRFFPESLLLFFTNKFFGK